MSTKYAIVGGKLIDGTGAEPVENSLVLVDDNGKIEYAGAMQDHSDRHYAGPSRGR